MIELREITADNWEQVANLKVHDDQQAFVAPNLYSIAESKFYPGVEIRAIYAHGELVGCIMWGPDPVHNPPEMWIWRFMIDAKQQGYGLAGRRCRPRSITCGPSRASMPSI